MSFEIKILGSNSASPVLNRHQTSQLLTIAQSVFLIDCGEATQYQLLKYKAKINRIDAVFISHLHGDHYLGLVGLISTMHLQGRHKDLLLFGPPGLDDIIILQLKLSETFLSYKLVYRELDTTAVTEILDLPQLTVETIPLIHRIKCCGFLFREKPKKRRLNKQALPESISLSQMAALKNGEDVKDQDGNVVFSNAEFTLEPRRRRSYAYCSDTMYTESILPQLHKIDLLYHESTFLSDMGERAALTYHSTAAQAAAIGTKAEVRQLIIGHFSSRYKDLGPLLEEAKKGFKNTLLAVEGAVFEIPEE